MAYSARPTSTDGLTKQIYQPAHGFTLGQVVIFNGSAYVLSKADTLAHSQSSLMVSIITDVDNFYVTQTGWVSSLPLALGLVAGTQYYVSPTVAGTLTSTIPSIVGQIVLSCFVADTTTSGYFYTSSGMQVESGQIFNWSIVSIDTIMTVNSGYFTSSLGVLNMTLPTVSTVGDIIRISNLGGNFTVVQVNAGHLITFGNDNTTLGAGGSITSAAIGDTVELICYNANAGWNVLSSMGNFTIV